ncbi:putative histone H2AXb [Hordeum vulgare]|nr:putative histone H2AXb [Hordeum vulgare]
MATAAAGGGRGKPKGSKSVSRSVKAGLQFLVGRVAQHLKVGRYAQRVGAGAPVYLCAVLEYLATQAVELADNAARDNNKKISSRWFMYRGCIWIEWNACNLVHVFCL